MGRYLLRRLLHSIFVLVGVTFLVYALMFLTGDPATHMVSDEWTVEQVEEFRHIMGFDQPWYKQYALFLARTLRGDLGHSLYFRQPVTILILERMPATLKLSFLALLFSLVVSFPAGIISAVKRNSIFDTLSRLVSILGICIPSFWLGIVLMLLFGVVLRWLPISGYGGWQHLILPVITLGSHSMATKTRMIRSSLLEVLGEDYVRTARAKGLREYTVLVRHAMRNALMPVITLIGLNMGYLLAGAVVTETVFAWPGVGLLTLNAISHKDFPLVTGCVTMFAGAFLVINLVVDLIQASLDPRVRLSSRRAT